MRNLVQTILAFLPLLSFGDDFFRFSSTEFAFQKNYPVFAFDISKPKSPDKVRVCCASVKSNKTDGVEFGVTIAEDMRDCSSVDSFGEDDRAFVRRAVLDGKNAFYSPSVSEDEQVRIKGKFWAMSDNAKAIVTRLDPNKDGSGGLNYICRLEMRPLERIYEETAPVRNLFCKPIKPIQVQMVDLEGKLKFDDKNNPVMTETVVCPLPKNCIKPDWEITPTARFIPGVDQTTAHAGSKAPAVVHIEPKPTAP